MRPASIVVPAAALWLATGLLAGPPPGVRWIAHRGGVVDAGYAENSPASLEAAFAAGYWMVESDIRETKDGRIIVQHDPTFERFYGDSRRVQDMTLAEVKALRANPGGTPPMTFRELVDACKGRLRIMLDTKEPEHSAAFYRQIENDLRRTGLLASAYIIGLDSARRYFQGKARVGINSAQLEEAVRRGEDVARRYFLFEWGKTLTRRQVDFAFAHKVPVVPSVNTFHYGGDWKVSLEQGSADIRRLREWGVTEFQIDSVYEPAFSDPAR